MKKWKAIRDCFVRDHRTNTATGTGQAASKRKRYVYYDQLLFLLPHVKGNLKTTSNIAPSAFQEHDEEETQGEEMHNLSTNEEEPASFGNSSPSTSTNDPAVAQKKGSKRKSNNYNVPTGKRTALERTILSSSKDLTNILASSLELQKEERNSDKYGHKAFLLSFVPVLDSMSYNTSMQLRGQISQVFSNYFAQIEGDSENRSHSSISSTAPATPMGFQSDPSVDYNISDYLQL